MKKLETYTVYGHCNLTNGKWYVGMTSREPKKRWKSGWGYQNNSQMWNDIMETDWNTDWIHIVFDKFNNKEDALDYESFLMGMFDSIEKGYNASAYGNSHFKPSEESKQKTSKSMGINGILQYSKTGEFIAEYPSLMEAERNTGCHNQNICKCCKGTRKSCGGFIWKYKEAC